MSGKDRDDFEDLFVRREDFNIENVYKIEYRNKPIYANTELEWIIKIIVRNYL